MELDTFWTSSYQDNPRDLNTTLPPGLHPSQFRLRILPSCKQRASSLSLLVRSVNHASKLISTMFILSYP
jgi:hypothetical protein